jgi:hypothetical protein
MYLVDVDVDVDVENDVNKNLGPVRFRTEEKPTPA